MVAAPQRQTRQRAAIADLLSRTDHFRTASQIHDDLRHQGEHIGLTTVYRTLLMMVNAGQLDLIRTGDGRLPTDAARWAPPPSRLPRLRTHRRGRRPAIERWTDHVADQHGFSDVQPLEIFGRCSSAEPLTTTIGVPSPARPPGNSRSGETWREAALPS